MSRYIDPIWLYENVLEQAPQFAETLKDLILVAPSIDIVRCEECISADEKPIADGRYWCNIHGCYMRFCSDGEREGE